MMAGTVSPFELVFPCPIGFLLSARLTYVRRHSNPQISCQPPPSSSPRFRLTLPQGGRE